MPQREAFPALVALTWMDEAGDLYLVKKCSQTFLRSPSDNCPLNAAYKSWYNIASNWNDTPRWIKNLFPYLHFATLMYFSKLQYTCIAAKQHFLVQGCSAESFSLLIPLWMTKAHRTQSSAQLPQDLHLYSEGWHKAVYIFLLKRKHLCFHFALLGNNWDSSKEFLNAPGWPLALGMLQLQARLCSMSPHPAVSERSPLQHSNEPQVFCFLTSAGAAWWQCGVLWWVWPLSMRCYLESSVLGQCWWAPAT